MRCRGSRPVPRRPDTLTHGDGAAGAVFAALADASRRHIVLLLRERGSATATALAPVLGMSRQAVVKHVRVLAQAGLVRVRRQGRESVIELDPAPLQDAGAWLAAASEAAWGDRLSALKRLVEDDPHAE